LDIPPGAVDRVGADGADGAAVVAFLRILLFVVEGILLVSLRLLFVVLNAPVVVQRMVHD